MSKGLWLLCLLLCWTGVQAGQTSEENRAVVVGSKNFGESYLLAEIAAQVLEAQGYMVTRQFGLGGTLICYEALKNGEIDSPEAREKSAQ